MPQAMVNAGGAVVAGKIYVVGGLEASGLETSARVLRYDPTANSWDRIADLPEGLTTPGVAAKGDTLLVIGGNGRAQGLAARANAWRWDEDQDTWVHHSALPLASVSPVVAGTSRGVLAAVLGDVSVPPGDSIAFQHHEGSEWKYAAPAPISVRTVASTGDKVWAVGLSAYADFDANTLTWSGTSSLPSGGFLVGAWWVQGRRHLLTRFATTASHLVLEDGAQLWTNAATPEGGHDRSDAIAVSVGTKLYLIGGLEEGQPTNRVDVFTWQ